CGRPRRRDVRGRDPGWSRANISSGRADPRGSACEPRLRRRGDAPAKRPGARRTIRARFAGPRKAPLWTFVRHRGELHAYRALPELLPQRIDQAGKFASARFSHGASIEELLLRLPDRSASTSLSDFTIEAAYGGPQAVEERSFFLVAVLRYVPGIA